MRLMRILSCLLALQACGGGAAPAPAPAPLPGPAESDPSVRISLGLTVCQVDGQALQGDLYRPPPGKQRHRALLFIHGGGWSTGSRAISPTSTP